VCNGAFIVVVVVVVVVAAAVRGGVVVGGGGGVASLTRPSNCPCQHRIKRVQFLAIALKEMANILISGKPYR